MPGFFLSIAFWIKAFMIPSRLSNPMAAGHLLLALIKFFPNLPLENTQAFGAGPLGSWKGPQDIA